MCVPGGVWCPDLALGTKPSFSVVFQLLKARQGVADQQQNGLMPCAGVMRRGTAGATPGRGAHRGTQGCQLWHEHSPWQHGTRREKPRLGQQGWQFWSGNADFVTSEPRFTGKRWKTQQPGKITWQNCLSLDSDPRESCCGAARGFGDSWGTR